MMAHQCTGDSFVHQGPCDESSRHYLKLKLVKHGEWSPLLVFNRYTSRATEIPVSKSSREK